jgi:hypothetical protein
VSNKVEKAAALRLSNLEPPRVSPSYAVVSGIAPRGMRG